MEKSSKEIKCVVWDLDNTVWDGILLEDSSVSLKPGIESILKELDKRGILNSVASKNNHEDAMKKLNDFGIEHYFLYPQISWNAKSVSLASIQKNLNIGMDTILFIDDQPFEREEVETAHPEIAVLDARDYEKLLDYPRMNPRFITEDSARRRMMYLQDMKRKEEEDSFQGPSEKFLESLHMKFIIHPAREDDLQRAEELTMRTNQLNTTGRTYDFEQLSRMIHNPAYRVLISELTDKYGSYGKIGLALVEITEKYWHIRLLLMSCRVMSRGVGSILMSYIQEECRKDGKVLRADFKQTDRNRMMYITYKFANFKEVEKGDDGIIVFENDLSMIQPFPRYLNVQIGK